MRPRVLATGIIGVVIAICGYLLLFASPTTLGTVPPIGHPLPSGGALTATAPVGAPTRLEVPALDIDTPLGGYGLRPDGAMELPPFGAAGWYDEGPRPGEAGGAVVVAHLTGPQGPDLFVDLATLRPGDEIRIHRTNGIATFVVDGVEDVGKDALPYDRIWPTTDHALLRLITCAGERDPVTLYPDNTIVYASLVADEASGAENH